MTFIYYNLSITRFYRASITFVLLVKRYTIFTYIHTHTYTQTHTHKHTHTHTHTQHIKHTMILSVLGDYYLLQYHSYRSQGERRHHSFNLKLFILISLQI